MKAFKREMRIARRTYRRELRVNFDAEVRAGQQGKEKGEYYPSFEKVEAEAWENYEFDGLMRFDGDMASQFVEFRESLVVTPPPPGGLDPALARAREQRTDALWESYRRVYFGETEQDPSHEQVMDRLRAEIAELEQRAVRARRDGDLPSSPDVHRKDDDGPPSPPANAPEIGSSAARGEHQSESRGSMTDPPSSVGSHGRGASDESGALCAVDSFMLPGLSSLSLIGEPRLVSFLGKTKCLVRKSVRISKKVLRRVLAAKESIFKFGVFVPKGDRQADSSPEAPRWKAGRDLEWLRLGLQGTFDGDWTWEKIQAAYPDYQKSDVGFLFYIYDF